MNQDPSPDSTKDPLDSSRLEKLRRLQEATGRNILTEVVDLYRTDTPERLDRLRRCLAEGDAGEAERLAHSIKGSSANIGAHLVMALAAEVEQDLANGSTDQVDGKLVRLESEVERACQALLEL